MGGEGYRQGIVQEIKIWPSNEWYIHNLESIFWDFTIQTDQLISAWRPDQMIVNKKKKKKKIRKKKKGKKKD